MSYGACISRSSFISSACMLLLFSFIVSFTQDNKTSNLCTDLPEQGARKSPLELNQYSNLDMTKVKIVLATHESNLRSLIERFVTQHLQSGTVYHNPQTFRVSLLLNVC